MKTMDQDFLRATQFIGAQVPFWVQGAGGNTSVKLSVQSENIMLIKSTGLRLDQVTDTFGLSALDLNLMLAKYNDQFLETADENDYSEFLKSKTFLKVFHNTQNLPSMESGFHVSLSKKYVFHFHSVVTHYLFQAYIKDDKKVLDWLKNQTVLKVCFLRFCYPGLNLSKQIHDHLGYDVYFLENHGVILQADMAQVLEVYIQFEKEFCNDFGLNHLYSYFKKTKSELIKEFENKAIPFKNYFPDTLVFKTEIIEYVLNHNQEDDTYSLKRQIDPQKQSLLEIWLATLILYTVDPQLPSLTDEHLDRLRNMPTEVTRRQKLES